MMQWLIPLILIAGLIFIHELGHFLAAKFVGVKVEEFSIGFPPRIFAKKWGETVYSVGILFLGGFVRLRGQNIEDEDPKEKGNYASKGVGAKFLILIAGVFFNLVLAFALLAYVFWRGSEVPAFFYGPAIVQNVEEGTIAKKAGFLAQDQLIRFNEQNLAHWQDFERAFRNIKEQNLITVKRGSEEKTLPLNKEELTRSNFGLNPRVPAIVGGSMKNYPAEQANLKNGDRILSINGFAVDSFGEVSPLMDRLQSQELKIELFRPKTENFLEESDSLESQAHFFAKLGAPVAKPNEGVSKKDFYSTQFGMEGEVFTLLLSPKLENGHYKIGIIPSVIKERHGFFESFGLAGKKLVSSVFALFDFFEKLFTGRVNKDEVGGPLMIFKIVSDASSQGLSSIFQIAALISFQLAFFNLLPIPALDGGHILLLGYEFFRKKAPPPKIRARIQMAGMILLLVLMIFLTWQDISRI